MSHDANAMFSNDMAKVQQKSEKITAFGGIFFVLDKFDRETLCVRGSGHSGTDPLCPL